MREEQGEFGAYTDWIAAARGRRALFPLAPPGLETQRRVRELLDFAPGDETPRDVRVDARWERDGVAGEAVSWSVGYGPRTEAWVLKPANAAGPLPGVLALHDHGGFKFYGKEKIADGPAPPDPALDGFRRRYYGGRAYANALAREGFVVVVPDTFLWGSRRWPTAAMNEASRRHGELTPGDPALPAAIATYNAATTLHEHQVEKYCALLGSTLAGVVSYEDRVAAAYLRGRADVQPDRIGCLGLSGGGGRAALLRATSPHLAAAAIVGMMTTYEHLLLRELSHTWMVVLHAWARHGDWPDLAACRAPAPLLVQYDLDDGLFTVAGMRAAHARLQTLYRHAGDAGAYTGEFYPGPHKFDLPMQQAAFAWLRRVLDDAGARAGNEEG